MEEIKEYIEKALRDLKREGIYGKIKIEIEGERAEIDLKKKVITINPDFVEKYTDRLPKEEIVKGLLEHEIGHFIYHPYDFKRVVAMDIALAKKGVDPKTRSFVRNRFDDIVVHLKLWERGKGKNAKEWWKISEDNSKFDLVERRLYEIFTGEDFGLGEDKELDNYAKNILGMVGLLSGNPVKSVRECKYQVVKFYEIIKPILKEDGDYSKDMSLFEKYSKEDIEDTVRELLIRGEITPEKARDYLTELNIHEKDHERKKPGNKFTYTSEVSASFIIYDTLSNKHLKIESLPIEENGGSYPFGYEKWEISDPIEKIDSFTSFGKIGFPGLTKKIIEKPFKKYGRKEKIPDLLLLLDDSGSMPNPVDKVSYAVLGAFIAAKSYLAENSEVAPVRFSDRTTNAKFMRNRKEILEELLKYKKGKTTIIDTEKLEKVKREVDVMIYTDGKIDNRGEVIDFLSSKRNFVRKYMFEIGEEGEPYFEEEVRVTPVKKEEDLIKETIKVL